MRARSLLALSAAAAFLWATSSAAITTPTGGAVAFPSSVKLVLPFPAGAKIRVSSGYSPSGGSSLHDGTMRTSSANDYCALDLVYDGIADGGFGKPILAPLDGKVVKSGWASVGWANYGQRVILRHDLGDGHVYHSIYCHLNACGS
jgi:murein DD-endopeptidase MepM/ murein hydrolase activator NlpD